MTAIAERAFRGELVVFRQLDALDALLDHARGIAYAAFDDPVRDEGRIDSGLWREKAVAARRSFMRSEAVPGLLCALFTELGFNPETTYRDRAILRFQPGRAACRTRRLRDLPPHRDTWGSNLMNQLNWWAPLFPLEPDATMEIWPGYFDRPVPNSSAGWDIKALRAAGGDYPLLPEAARPEEPGEPVLIEPGELLCFSGAHLHASRPNRTGRTRISIDLRTVDVMDGQGAPNVDGLTRRTGYDWFHRLSDGACLASAR
ncbi:MAG: hypothetical protein F4X35_01955 [Alphaproteobacteria bacterium]|nr:hypothetical protein [Alphaproteobacteria bacterium]